MTSKSKEEDEIVAANETVLEVVPIEEKERDDRFRDLFIIPESNDRKMSR